MPSPSAIPTSPNALLGLQLIEEELYSICRNDTVKREDVFKLCNRLGVDGKDEQVAELTDCILGGTCLFMAIIIQ